MTDIEWGIAIGAMAGILWQQFLPTQRHYAWWIGPFSVFLYAATEYYW